ncbi:Hypothetical protein, putative [Bodo saltans]|uniref:Uncharacterized protein n=1 Tax=Bodo saltans TaxID=75058 RepID=A0A0S4J0B0_BODSA|nr:Hypothetical protein, putative [Bodo saltans]|eukprot:CUG16974.1 Hypothetical protein, putative [Bodo saltans]
MVTARGSGGGSRLEELETAAEYQRLLYEGHSEQLLDMKKHVRRVERKHQAQVQAANNKMKSFEADVDRVKASGTWALQRHCQQQQTTPNALAMMGTSSSIGGVGGGGSAQRHQRGAGGSSSNNKGGTIQISARCCAASTAAAMIDAGQ